VVSGTKLVYNYLTEIEEYSDGSSARFLLGELIMENLNTYYFVDATGGVPDSDHSLRMSVGWRNP
jgi:hypothetical protein